MNYIKNCNESYLSEAFQRLRLLEDDLNLSKLDEYDNLSDFVADDADDIPEIPVIDADAETAKELKRSYAGKIALECNCCHSWQYKDGKDIIIDGDEANPDDKCPVCGQAFGYTIHGKGADEEVGYEDLEDVDNEEIEDEQEEEVKGESLKESKMSLEDRLARKHLEADESLDEQPIEESALREDNWDKLTAAYPELEDGEIHEEMGAAEEVEESAELTELFGFGKKKKEVDTSFDDYESDRDSWDSMAKSHADETDKRLSKIARQQNDQDNYKARLERDRAEQRKHDEYKARTGRDWYDRPAQDHEFRSGEWRPVEEDLGDDAADFLWEGNKITVDGEDYEIISMGADVLTVEDADGQTVEFDLAELAGKPYSVVDYDGEYYEHKPSVGESLTEDDDEDICPECGKKPCDCEKHEHHHGHHCEEGCGKKLHEGYSNVLNDINDMSEGDTVVMSIDGSTGRFAYIGTLENGESGVGVYQFKPLDKNSAALAKAFTEDELGLDFNGLYELTDEDIFYNPFYNETKDLVYLGDSEGFEDEIADGIKQYLKSDEVTEGCGKRVNEAVEVHASGEDAVAVSKNDDGSMTINVGQTQVEGESIVPLSDEEQAQLQANTGEEEVEDGLAAEEPVEEVPEEGAEEEAPAEEGEEEVPAEEEEEDNTQEESLDTHIGDFNDHKFNDLVEGFLRKVYDNVKTFETTRVKDLGESFIVEGLIKYKSGKAANTKFVFENAFFAKNGNLIMEGYNATFSKNDRSFRIRGSLNKGNFVTESMIYNYNVKQLNESNKQETITISGRVKAR